MNTLFYKIEKNGKLAYLIGSFHVHTQHPKVSLEVLSAFEQAEQVMFEADVDKFSEVKKRFEERCESWKRNNPHVDQLSAEQIEI